MTHRELNGHMADDVTWPWKVKVGTPIRLELTISKAARDRCSAPMDHRQEMSYGESHGHVIDDVTCPVFLVGTDYILSRHLQNQ